MRPPTSRRTAGPAILGLSLAITLAPTSSTAAPTASSGQDTSTASEQTLRPIDGRFIVTLAGSAAADGTFAATGTSTAVDSLLASAGGSVVNDMSTQIGVLLVESSSPAFADVLRNSPLVEAVGNDFGVKMYDAAAPDPVDDPLEPAQWDMQQIRTDEAHAVQAGIRAVDVGILDSGIDGNHLEFKDSDGTSNVDCGRGRNSIAFVPVGPGVGNPEPCVDNQFHGTHVAGTVGAQSNDIGIVGVAPGVTLVPVKVCDTSGYCYASAVVDGVTYSGDQQFDVINMSFFVDDNEFQESTEFKCSSDPTQRSFRQAVERAMQYARSQGVTPVAALGNSDTDLAHPEDEQGVTNECEVVPAETQGVIGTSSLGRDSEKAGYSNYGTGANDVAAPGGNGSTGDCNTTVLSTFPGGTYGCIQGTSMASPHAAGVAALIVSQYGELGADGDVKLSPQKVESLLQSTTIDIGEAGYDTCFGNGRIDALRAVTGDTSAAYDSSAPACPEYAE